MCHIVFISVRPHILRMTNFIIYFSPFFANLLLSRYVLTLELLGNHKVPVPIRQRLLEKGDGMLSINSTMRDDAPMAEVVEMLTKVQRSFVITNMEIDDQPIIYASPLFLQLTGYSLEEVVGVNCRFLQGKDTNRDDVAKMAESIRWGLQVNVALLNYRKDGTPFWTSIHLAPIKNSVGEVLLYVGIQVEICAEKAVAMKAKAFTEGINSFTSELTDGEEADCEFGSVDKETVESIDDTDTTDSVNHCMR